MVEDTVLLHSSSSAPSGKKLADYLGIEATDDLETRQVDKLIRWGTTQGIKYVPDEQTYNLKSASETAVNKYDALEALKNAQLSVPKFSRNIVELDYPLLCRDDRHTQGSDITLALQQNDVDEFSDHYVKYVPTQKEFRVHVVDGSVVKVSEKRFTGEADDQLPHIRNYETGYTFHHPEEEPSGLRPQAVAAVEALGLHFGAVDIILGEDDNVYVLEVNTAPALDTETSLEAYGDAIADMIGLDSIPGHDTNPDEPESPGERIRAVAGNVV